MTAPGPDELKPIETRYKGFRFRSRLEARWAVFLDAIGVEWEFEKQGYDLGGTWYLPDFWLPYESMKEEGWGIWLEIKPTPLDDDQIRLLAELARQTGHRTFALCGTPWPGEHSVYVFQHHHLGPPESIPLVSGGKLVETNSHAGTEFEGMGVRGIEVRSSGRKFPFVQGYKFASGQSGSLAGAFGAARGARFEHGETPRP